MFTKQQTQKNPTDNLENSTFPKTLNRASVKESIESSLKDYIGKSYGKLTAYFVNKSKNNPSESLENHSFSTRTK